MRFTPKPDGTGIPIYEQLQFKGMPIYSLDPTTPVGSKRSTAPQLHSPKSAPTFHFGGHHAKTL